MGKINKFRKCSFLFYTPSLTHLLVLFFFPSVEHNSTYKEADPSYGWGFGLMVFNFIAVLALIVGLLLARRRLNGYSPTGAPGYVAVQDSNMGNNNNNNNSAGGYYIPPGEKAGGGMAYTGGYVAPPPAGGGYAPPTYPG